ncbi:cytochrome P450 [Streptosporangium sp. KLBMP 9127]|nr:cytochrome P450 [Streptosporangium sp. KLBMP 9127]
MIDPVSVLGFDPFDPGFLRDPYEHYRRLRERGPLVRTEAGMWVATGHAPCTAVLRDTRFGHGGVVRPARSFLTMDPPEHTRLRGLVSRAFTPRMIERLRPRIVAITDELIAGLEADAEVISQLAYPLPVRVISEMLGVPPRDHERFQSWSLALARGLDPGFLLPPDVLDAREQARMDFRAYFADLFVRLRAEPGDDLLSELLRQDEMTEDELLSACILLIVAGHETTVNLIGNGVLALTRAGQAGHLADHPDHAPAVVEELLRYDPPVQLTTRVANTDAELCGTLVRKGETVLALLGSANRDPVAFADPDRLDLGRFATARNGAARPSGRHLAFGLGVHFCLGAPLARMEAEIALTALAGAAPGLVLTDPAPPYKENLVLRGLAWLAVRKSA